MNMIQSVTSVLKNYANFKGRASRSEYWWFILFVEIFAILYNIYFWSKISSALTTGEDLTQALVYAGQHMGPVAPLYTIFSFGIYIPTVAVTYRRFHDINKSGWNFLWMLTVIGCIPVLVWLCRKSEPQSNKYGADPLAQKAPNQSGITADASAAASAPAPAPVSTQGEVDFDKLEKLSQLHKSGVLSDEEFATQKAKVLGA